ncbi:ribosome maturation factor RimP [Rhizohabitans arisaemae]|uniref:ribosome maturation factor RimP n=1 Tax=Rhizohabitans arisaemae TaxID=2720610 RepID=UPI0024B1530B|nr:ribosome maturation factor RimP [Rhizohabitans arisaemae]
MSNAAHRDNLIRLLEPVVTAAGLELEDLTIAPAGRRRLVRVVVDADGGVSLDAVAAVSQAVSKVLDDADPFGGAPYVLEVGSPGVDRPLTEARHWRRARTRLVKADLREGGSVEGRVTGADDEGVELEVGGEQRRYSYQDLARGRVQVEFRRDDDDDDDSVDVDTAAQG